MDFSTRTIKNTILYTNVKDHNMKPGIEIYSVPDLEIICTGQKKFSKVYNNMILGRKYI